MLSNRKSMLLCSGLSLISACVFGSSASAADVTVTNAAIQGGKLMVTGTTASPNTWVRLDGQKAAAFNTKSGANRAFNMAVVYHPGDCVVELQSLVSPTKLGAATEAVVANCGPAGILPRGAWSAKASYETNDLVTHDGSSWRARRGNAGKQPGVAADWEVFAAKGEAADEAGSEAAGAAGEAGSDDSADAKAAKVAPTGPAGGDLTGTYPNPTIRALAVTTGKIGNLAVTANKIRPNAITTSKIARFAVTNVKLAPNSVGTLKIGDNAVTNPKLGPDAVTTDKVLDETLTAGDLGPDSVGSSEILTDAVTADEIAADAVGASEIAADSVGSSEIAANAVGQSEIATDGVDASEIADNSIDGGEIVNGSVGQVELTTIAQRSQVSAAIAANGTGSATATCAAGERVISGGNDTSDAAAVFVVASRREGNGWRVFVRNTAAGSRTVTAHAYCLQ